MKHTGTQHSALKYGPLSSRSSQFRSPYIFIRMHWCGGQRTGWPAPCLCHSTIFPLSPSFVLRLNEMKSESTPFCNVLQRLASIHDAFGILSYYVELPDERTQHASRRGPCFAFICCKFGCISSIGTGSMHATRRTFHAVFPPGYELLLLVHLILLECNSTTISME